MTWRRRGAGSLASTRSASTTRTSCWRPSWRPFWRRAPWCSSSSSPPPSSCSSSGPPRGPSRRSRRSAPSSSLSVAFSSSLSVTPALSIGSYSGNIPSPLARLGLAVGIFSLPSLDWVCARAGPVSATCETAKRNAFGALRPASNREGPAPAEAPDGPHALAFARPFWSRLATFGHVGSAAPRRASRARVPPPSERGSLRGRLFVGFAGNVYIYIYNTTTRKERAPPGEVHPTKGPQQSAGIRLFGACRKRPPPPDLSAAGAGVWLLAQVLNQATQEIDNPDLRDRCAGPAVWRSPRATSPRDVASTRRPQSSRLLIVDYGVGTQV
eukprot:1189471-Prorocentrum_minimum.AAC.2